MNQGSTLGQNTNGSSDERAMCPYCLNQFAPSVLEQHVSGCAVKFNFLIQRKDNSGVQFPVFLPVQSNTVPSSQIPPNMNTNDVANIPVTWVTSTPPTGYKLYSQVGNRTFVYHQPQSWDMSYQNIYMAPYNLPQGANTFTIPKTTTQHPLPNPMSFYPVYPTKPTTSTASTTPPTTTTPSTPPKKNCISSSQT